MSNTQSSQNLNLNGYFDKGWNQRIGFNEELLFYVDHGVVYDGNGAVMGNIFHPTTIPPGQQSLLTGYPEVLIVPVPGFCSRYYIISAYMLAPGGPTGTNPVPGFATLDLETGRLINADPNGDVVTTTLSNDQTGIWTNYNVHCSEMHLACSEPLPNGNRWLFISNCGGLYRAEITSTGISQAVAIHSFQGSGGSYGSTNAKSELEVWETPAGVTPKFYRIAAPLKAGNNHIGLVQLDNNGNFITGTEIIIIPTIPPSGASHNLKGMEFSPDGNYLYITSDVGAGLRCFDVSNGATVALPQITSFPAEFSYSMIERGKDQTLYVVSTERVVGTGTTSVLGRIANPNTPTSATFDPNWKIFATRHIDPIFPAGNFQTSTGGTGGSNPQFTNLNVLPDQMDGEDYLATIPFATLACCDFTTDYADEGPEPLQTSIEQTVTWEPGNNPAQGASTIWIKGVLEVQTGVNLTLRNLNFHFGPQGKIIVHPGARLDIQSCVLSGNPRCSTMWQGIEVWGDVNQGEGLLIMSQWPGSQRSRIEQAITGISTRDAQSIANIKDGGRIELKDGDFSNNSTDIFYWSTPLSGSYSVIKDCNFTSQNGALWHPFTGATTSTHVWLKEVEASDIIFTGLDNRFLGGKVGIFLNETHNLQIDDMEFENCDIGIWSMQTGVTGLPSQTEINRNVFRGVHTSIKIENGIEDEISLNIFNSLYPGQNGINQSQDKNFYGVFLNACGNYRVTDNIFNHHKYGMYIRNTGEYTGWVDAVQNGNFFNECWRGIHTEGDNQLVQIRCNTFNNANQPASQFSTAWFVNGDLPNQGGPGPDPTLAAGNYSNRPFPRTDLNGVIGNTATSCDPTKNFCYYYNQFSTSGNVNPAIGTTNTITKNQNPATQTGCIFRASLMDLSGHDPELARELIENESNPVLKAQYTLELTQWYRSQNLIDSVLSLLYTVDNKRQLYSDYVNLDSLSLASNVLTDLEASGLTEDVAFSQVNRLLLELKQNGQALHQLDSSSIAFLRSVVNMNLQVSEQARGILYLIDSVYTPLVIESDTGSFNRISNTSAGNEENPLSLINNPAIDQLQFKWMNRVQTQDGQVLVEITTTTGQVVCSESRPVQELYTVNLSKLSKGFYLLRVRDQRSQAVARFSKL